MAIVKMKRLRLFGMLADRQELLRQLQRLGCVEIDEPADKLSDPEWAALVTRPGGDALSESKERRALVSSSAAALQKYAPVKTGLFTPRRAVTEQQLFDDGARAAALAAAEAIAAAERTISSLYAEQSRLNTQLLALAPWLTLDVPLETGSTQDAAVIFGTIGVTAPFEAVERDLREATPLAQLIPAGADRELRYLLFVCHKSGEEAALKALERYGFSHASLRGWTGTAAENTARLKARLAELDRELAEARAAVAAYGSSREGLRLCLDRMDQEIAREEAKINLLSTSATFFLEGWVPVPDVTALGAVLGGFVCAWETADPQKEDYPRVPVKLKSNPLTRPLNMVTEMYSLPAYDGIDPNPLMTPFFVLFFGIMYSDLGYGLILILFSLIVRKKARPKGTMRYLFELMTLVGISTAVVGFFTGGFFSDSITTVAGLLGVPVPNLSYLTSPVISVIKDPMRVLLICLAIGCVQLLFGMGVKAYMLVRDGQPWDALFDIGSWWVLFAGIAVGVLSGRWFVLLLGIALLVLTQGRSSPSIPGKLIGGLASLYNITSYFGDVLSYSRLMVMMLAGSVIGSIFNLLGAMPGNLFIFFIVFVIGHIFNMGLNIIGTFVHTARLQYLEFFGKFYKEGGRPFRPLDFNTQFVDIVKEESKS